MAKIVFKDSRRERPDENSTGQKTKTKSEAHMKKEMLKKAKVAGMTPLAQKAMAGGMEMMRRKMEPMGTECKKKQKKG